MNFKFDLASSPTACGNDRTQRVLDIGEGSSNGDDSYIGESNVLASSSSEEDHNPVVFAPPEVADPLAELARAISGHRDVDKLCRNNLVGDARMDPLVQKALKGRRQKSKRSNIIRPELMNFVTLITSPTMLITTAPEFIGKRRKCWHNLSR